MEIRFNNLSVKWLLITPVLLLSIMIISNMLWQLLVIYGPADERATTLLQVNEITDGLLLASARQAEERGFTAAYLSSTSQPRLAEILISRVHSLRSAAQTTLQSVLPGLDRFLTQSATSRLKEANHQLQQANQRVIDMRRRVDSAGKQPGKLKAAEWEQAATDLIEAMTALRLALLAPSSDNEVALAKNSTLKHALWLASEYSGRERAVVGQALAIAKPLDQPTLARLYGYRSITERQLSYLKGEITALPSPAQGGNTSINNDYRQAWRAVEQRYLGSYQLLREKIYLAATSATTYPVDAATWMQEATQAIDTLHNLGAVVSRDVAWHAERAKNQAKNDWWKTLAIAFSALASILLTLFAVSYVTRQLHQPEVILARIYKEKNLRLRLPEAGKSELSSMGRAFNQMLQELSDFTSGISKTTASVAQLVERLKGAADDTGRHVRQQEAELEQAATAMTEMSSTARDVADSIALAADAAETAEAEAIGIQQVVAKSNATISSLAEQIAHSAEVIGHLQHESSDIGKILEVINEIADETNLLALNAAIEAARAGDQGRGFAVVADEVRRLANRTQASTGEITAMIKRFQERSSEAVEEMICGRQMADEGAEQVHSSGERLESIVNSVSVIHNMNMEIASAAQQQSLVAEEINRSINSIAEAASSTTLTVSDSQVINRDIALQMDRLRELLVGIGLR